MHSALLRVHVWVEAWRRLSGGAMQEPRQADVLHEHGVHARRHGRPPLPAFRRFRQSKTEAGIVLGRGNIHQFGHVGQAKRQPRRARALKPPCSPKIQRASTVLHGRPPHNPNRRRGASNSGKIRGVPGINVCIDQRSISRRRPLYPHPRAPGRRRGPASLAALLRID